MKKLLTKTSIKPLLAWFSAALLLAACADEPLNLPKELADIDEKFELDTRWDKVIGDSDDGKFNSLVPAIWEDKIITADVKGLVTAFDRNTGDILWEKELDKPVSGGVTATAGLVALGTKDAEVVVMDINNGDVNWTAEVSTEILARPAIDGGKIIVRTADGRIFALDLLNGKQLWFYDRIIPNLTIRGTSDPIAVGGIVISGFANGKISTFNVETGDLLWEQRLSSPRGSSEISRIVDVDANPVIFGNNLYAAGYDGFAISMDLQTGRFLWREKASVLRKPLVDALRVYLVNTDGQIVALDRATGKELWKQEAMMYRNLTAAADNDDYIIVGDFEGYLHWLDKSTGEIVAREFLDGHGVSAAPIVSKDTIYATSRYGYLYALKNPLTTEANAD